MSNALDLRLQQGSDFRRILTIQNQEGLIDLTGSTFASMARVNFTDPEPAFVFDFEILDQVLYKGQVVMKLSHEDSSAIQLGVNNQKQFFYDVEWTKDDFVTCIMKGKITVSAEATK